MLNLRSFIESIQQAVLSANDALVDKNIGLLDRFFERDADVEQLQEKLDAAIQASDELNEKGSKASAGQLQSAQEAFKALQEMLAEEATVEDLLTESDLRPKTVSMAYPVKGKDGTITKKEVQVPLITLVPLTFSKIEEFKLRANLTLHVVDDEVQVRLGKVPSPALPEAESDTEGGAGRNANIGTVEILIKPQQMADGMQQVVDAYENVLKTQLPQ
ncbi:MAG: DUF2589 domain-containing protein [Bacteroidota bacterium]